MSEEQQRPANAIAVLASRKEVEDVEAALATAFREAWPDWVFERAIRTDLTGPSGEPYVRLDRLSYHELGLGDVDTDDEDKRRGPPLHARDPATRRGPPTDARVPAKVRDMIDGKVISMPPEWRETEEESQTKRT